MAFALFLMVALARSQDRQKGQGPDTTGPRNITQEHHRDPAQAARLYKMALARTDGVAVDASGSDVFAPASLNGLINAKDQGVPTGQTAS